MRPAHGSRFRLKVHSNGTACNTSSSVEKNHKLHICMHMSLHVQFPGSVAVIKAQKSLPCLRWRLSSKLSCHVVSTAKTFRSMLRKPVQTNAVLEMTCKSMPVNAQRARKCTHAIDRQVTEIDAYLARKPPHPSWEKAKNDWKCKTHFPKGTEHQLEQCSYFDCGQQNLVNMPHYSSQRQTSFRGIMENLCIAIIVR